jgi:hypothetical protein
MSINKISIAVTLVTIIGACSAAGSDPVAQTTTSVFEKTLLLRGGACQVVELSPDFVRTDGSLQLKPLSITSLKAGDPSPTFAPGLAVYTNCTLFFTGANFRITLNPDPAESYIQYLQENGGLLSEKASSAYTFCAPTAKSDQSFILAFFELNQEVSDLLSTYPTDKPILIYGDDATSKRPLIKFASTNYTKPTLTGIQWRQLSTSEAQLFPVAVTGYTAAIMDAEKQAFIDNGTPIQYTLPGGEVVQINLRRDGLNAFILLPSGYPCFKGDEEKLENYLLDASVAEKLPMRYDLVRKILLDQLDKLGIPEKIDVAMKMLKELGSVDFAQLG